MPRILLPFSCISIFSSFFFHIWFNCCTRIITGNWNLDSYPTSVKPRCLAYVRVCSWRFVVAHWLLGLLQLLQRLDIQSILPSWFVSTLGLFLQNVGMCPWIDCWPLDCSSTINLLRLALVRQRLDKTQEQRGLLHFPLHLSDKTRIQTRTFLIMPCLSYLVLPNCWCSRVRSCT